MDLRISENIRAYRKQRNMMQEQLAEVLGVSVGAVSKWERGAAVPDLGYIIRMAELFEVSVDSLLGYALNKSGLAATLDKLDRCSKQNLFEEGKEVAEKALKQFPNNFLAVYRSGSHYMLCAISHQDPLAARRAIELLHRSLELFSDNTDSSIFQEEIYHDISLCHMLLDEHEEAIRLLTEHNPRHIHDGDIGMIYANYMGQPEKAFPYLEKALDHILARLCRTILGFAAAYDATKQYQKILDVWNWMANLLTDLKKDTCEVFYYQKFVAITYVNCAQISVRLGRVKDAAGYLRKAYTLAETFDRAPVYSLAGAKFDEGKLSSAIHHDNLGETALERHRKGTAKRSCHRSDAAGIVEYHQTGAKEKMKLTRKDFTRQFYKGNIGNFSLALFSYTLLAVPSLAVSFLIQQLVDIASGVDTVFTFGQTIALCGGGVGLFLIGYILEYVSRPRFISRAMSQYKNFVFEKLSKKNISAFSGENTALYISALSNDANTIENDYLAQITTAFILIIQGAGALAMMLLYSPLLTLISIALMLIPVLVAVLTGNRLAKAEEQVSQKNAGFVSTLKDALTGFSVIKSFQAEIAACKLFTESVKSAEDAKVSRRKIATILEMLGNISGIIAQIGVFVVGAGLAIAGNGISAGVVMAFVQLMNYLLAPVQTLPQFFASRKASHALIDKLAEALSANVRQDGEPISKDLQTAIEVKDLTFGYTEEKTVLSGVDFRFEAGKSYALVGASGSGKSTLLNLLMGSYGNYDGQILYDGQELHQIRSDSLYELISIIQQNVFVFNNTIHNNITMFHEFPEDKVEEAIKLSGLTQLIEERGAEYLCGENGSGLSGGEKQRISIARSLLKESSVLLVDEATASLDAQTANQVASAILGLDGLTRIVVTHDLEGSILKQYDCILALKNGTIAESGTFDELMEQKQYFYSLYTVSQ